MIDKYRIEDVIHRANIIDISRRYLHLKKAGRNYKALCPFHSEKTPSFVMSEEKQIYHCFGCGEGGNVVSFLMKIENLSFIEAVKMLAKEVGIELQDFNKNDNLSESYRIMELINSYNIKNLKNNKTVSEYLKKRKLNDELISYFKIGYGGNNLNYLKNYLKNNNINKNLLFKLGIVTQSSYNDIYYRFLNRVTFPIFDITGRVIAFGGRIIDENKKTAKYVNSSDSIIFKKGKNLYNLHNAKKQLLNDDFFILAEGYIDVIILHQFGFKNAVACLGTSLTDDQAKLLQRYTKNICVIYDADEAGQKAADRSIEILIDNNIIPKIVVLDDDLDPADYLLKYGAEKLKHKIDNAQYYLDYKLERLTEKFNPDDINNKKIILNNFFKYLVKPDIIIRDTYFRKLSQILSLSEKVVVVEYNNFVRRYNKNNYVVSNKNVSVPSNDYNLPDLHEIELLSLMIIQNEIIEYIKHCKEDLFLSDEVMDLVNSAFETDSISTSSIGEEKNLLLKKITEKIFEIEKRIKSEDDLVVYIKDVLKKIKKKKIKDTIKRLSKELKKNQSEKELNFEILKEINNLQKQLVTI